jgi:hypothetical protein
MKELIPLIKREKKGLRGQTFKIRSTCSWPLICWLPEGTKAGHWEVSVPLWSFRRMMIGLLKSL